ncbi:MAG: chemotaxis protein CheA [Actinomycetota bacterium]|nr:chemotaxis protein CheA [Actinomycetota bacterium]
MPSSLEVLQQELESLSLALAAVDEQEKDSLPEVRPVLERVLALLKPPPPEVKNEAVALSRAAGKFLRGRKGGFKELSRALDRLIIALQEESMEKQPGDAEGEAIPGGERPGAKTAAGIPPDSEIALTEREVEELCMDLDVLAGLAEELQPSFLPGMLNIVERNRNRPYLPPSLGERLDSARELLLRIQEGDSDAGAEFPALLEAIREELSSLGEVFARGLGSRAAEEEAALEEGLERLEELESLLLAAEEDPRPDLAPVARLLRELAERAPSLGFARLSEPLAGVSEMLASLPPSSDLVDLLLRFKDRTHYLLRSRMEGGEEDAEEILEILETVSSFSTPSNRKTAPESGGAVQESPELRPQEGLEADEEELADFLAEAPEDVQRIETALLELEKDPTSREWLHEAFRGFHNLKGSAGFLNLKDMVNVAHAAENLLSEAREGRVELTGAYADLALCALDLLKEMLRRVEEHTRGNGYSSPLNYPQVMKRLLAWKELGGDSPGGTETRSFLPGRPAVGCGEKAGARAPSTAQESGGSAPGGPSLSQPKEHFVKVSTRRLDSLVDVVGELVIAHSMVAQEEELRFTRNPRLAKNLSQLSKIVRELQELAMSLRMVSLRNTFQKMARAARDLSVRSGVPVEFTYSGEDTEIDRNVVEEIANPLVHMIRNAIDHGIEPPQERRSRGKPEAGRLHLRGYHQGGNVVIELEDDGRGIDTEKVLARAISLGLVREGEELTREEILQFIFSEGFSTADKVTDISGRGVGMDVVRRTVENLRGRVEVHSEPGRGTRVTLRLPLTLAIIDGMVTRVAGENYILPSIAIRESFRPEPGQVKTVSGRGEVILSRGELIPLFRLHRLFALPGAEEDPYRALVLVLGENGRKCGLLVDDIEGQQQVVIKPLGEALPRLPGVAGGAIMGSGRVALILDPQELLALALRR